MRNPVSVDCLPGCASPGPAERLRAAAAWMAAGSASRVAFLRAFDLGLELCPRASGGAGSLRLYGTLLRFSNCTGYQVVPGYRVPEFHFCCQSSPRGPWVRGGEAKRGRPSLALAGWAASLGELSGLGCGAEGRRWSRPPREGEAPRSAVPPVRSSFRRFLVSITWRFTHRHTPLWLTHAPRCFSRPALPEDLRSRLWGSRGREVERGLDEGTSVSREVLRGRGADGRSCESRRGKGGSEG